MRTEFARKMLLFFAKDQDIYSRDPQKYWDFAKKVCARTGHGTMQNLLFENLK